MNIVYYSLVSLAPHSLQWVQSIRSLRKHNQQIPVHLFFYETLDLAVRREAHRQNVVLHDMGSYAASFAGYGNRQAAFTYFRTLHKFRNLRRLPPADQVLYIDCDTFFFADVEQLFSTYRSAHFYAREEVMTRLNHYGYNPDWVDESILDQVAASQHVRRVIPCNTGVCLMNHNMWLELADRYDIFLDFAWRLLVGAHVKLDPHLAVVRDYLTEADRADAIHNYPTSSIWIFEEVATWLTLGGMALQDEVISRFDVAQGGECDPVPSGIVLAHYWTNGESKFFNAIEKLT